MHTVLSCRLETPCVACLSALRPVESACALLGRRKHSMALLQVSLTPAPGQGGWVARIVCISWRRGRDPSASTQGTAQHTLACCVTSRHAALLLAV